MSSTMESPTSSMIVSSGPAPLAVVANQEDLETSNGSNGLEGNIAALSDNHSTDLVKELPWWRQPSPWWLLVTVPLLTIAFSATIAPRIEIYTYVACREYRPETVGLGSSAFNAALSQAAHGFPSNLSSPEYVSGYGSFLAVFPPYQDKHRAGLDEQLPCASDPIVQAAAARLIAVVTTTMGILTCLTTGFWGSFSDRHGRTRVMGIALLGALVADLVFISVVHFYDILPGGAWFLLVAPIVEGLLGGMAAGEASIQSYMADVTHERDRSRFFSLTMGLMLVGVALGPTLGSILIASTHNTLSAFYFVAGLHASLALWAFFILPESVSKERRQQFQEKYLEELRSSSLEQEDQITPVNRLTKFQRFLPFLRSLAVFLPYQESGNPLKKKRDWSLTLVALSFGSAVAIMGCYPFKLQYAAATFHWDSVDLGYYIGLVGMTSGLFLTLVFPIITKLLRPKPTIIEVLDTSSNPPSVIQKEIYSTRFDLNLVKVSLILNVAVYCLIGLYTGALVFTLLSMFGSFGLGISPAMQSVALALYTRQGGTEVGRLFGGLGVVSALCSQFFGPFFYGVIYSKTVASYPRTIFFVCAASLGLALVFISMIRIPEDGPGHKLVQEDLEETEPLLSNGLGTAQTTTPAYGTA